MRRVSLLFLSATVLIPGCARLPDDSSGSEGGEANLCAIQAELFDTTCIDCHSGDKPSAGMSLEDGKAWASLVGVTSSELDLPLVAPGDPEGSYLYHKLAGSHESVGGSGGQMPLGGSPVPVGVLQQVSEWITLGAPSACDGSNTTPEPGTPTPIPEPTPTIPPLPEDPTLCDVQELVFDQYCISCHSGSKPSSGMDLASGKSYDAIVNVAAKELATMDRVEPGKPQTSYLFHKISGTHGSVGGSGSQMPLGGDPLAKPYIDLVETWIQSGAIESCTGATPTPEPTETPANTDTPEPSITPTVTPTATPTPEPTLDPTDHTFCNVQTFIFDTYCIGCHSGASPTGGLNLTSAVSYKNLVDVPSGELPTMDRIEPNYADSSYLYRKVSGTHIEAGGSGARMPKDGDPLTSDELLLIANWINHGASASCTNVVADDTSTSRLESMARELDAFDPTDPFASREEGFEAVLVDGLFDASTGRCVGVPLESRVITQLETWDALMDYAALTGLCLEVDGEGVPPLE